jgi:hypothetical protein
MVEVLTSFVSAGALWRFVMDEGLRDKTLIDRVGRTVSVFLFCGAWAIWSGGICGAHVGDFFSQIFFNF